MRTCKCGAPLDYAADSVKAGWECRDRTIAVAVEVMKSVDYGASITIPRGALKWGIRMGAPLSPYARREVAAGRIAIGQWVSNGGKGTALFDDVVEADAWLRKNLSQHFTEFTYCIEPYTP